MKRLTWWILMTILCAISLTLGLMGNFLASLILFFIFGAPLCENYPSKRAHKDAGEEIRRMNQ